MIACGYNIAIKNEKNEIYICGCHRYQNKFEKVENDLGEIKNIACGGDHIAIQNGKNEIYVCGYNEHGQLGLGDYKYRDKFEKVEYDFGEIKNIACGHFHTVIQNEKNEIYVCGLNTNGQLGLCDNKHRNTFEKVNYDFGEIKKIACGYSHTVIQNEKNETYVCGSNWHGQLGLGDNRDRNIFEKVRCDLGEIKNIACGHNYTVIQNEKNEIYVCGYNICGQLGFGDKKERNKFKKVNFDFGEIKNISCGEYHTVIQNVKNEIYVCGDNKYGQLGLGDNIVRKRFKNVESNFGKIKKIACGNSYTVIQNEKNEIYICGVDLCGHLVSGNYSYSFWGEHKSRNRFEKIDTGDILEKIYNFALELNEKEIVL